MQVLSREQVTGNQVDLRTTRPAHINGNAQQTLSNEPVQAFADVLFNAVEQVNNQELDASQLEQKLAVSPDEVDIHEVMIASEKARLSVSLLKSVVDKAIKAYNDIMMIR